MIVHKLGCINFACVGECLGATDSGNESLRSPSTEPAPKPESEPQCSGPFSDARDCPVHRHDVMQETHPWGPPYDGASVPPKPESEARKQYQQGVRYGVEDIWSAFEAGCKETRDNCVGGHAITDRIVSQSADAYCKLVAPLVGAVPVPVTPQPESVTCSLCSDPAVGRYALDRGCAAYPDAREQDLCWHHLNRAEPIGGMTEIRSYRAVPVTEGEAGEAERLAKFCEAFNIRELDEAAALLRSQARELEKKRELGPIQFSTFYEEKIAELSRQLEALVAEKIRFSDKNAALRTQLEEAKADVDWWQRMTERAQDSGDKLADEVGARRTGMERLQLEVAALRTQLEEARTENEGLREALRLSGASAEHASDCMACDQAQEIGDRRDTGCEEWLRLEHAFVDARSRLLEVSG